MNLVNNLTTVYHLKYLSLHNYEIVKNEKEMLKITRIQEFSTTYSSQDGSARKHPFPIDVQPGSVKE